MKPLRIAPDVGILPGAVNTGVITSGDRALLIDCCDSVTPERLHEELGVERVDMILCTQHRRANVAGAYAFVERGAQLIVPSAERHLFDDVEAYWGDPKNRWHLYHHQPGQQVLARSIPVARAVSGGEVVEWAGRAIRVLDTPGATDGSVSYVLDARRRRVAFCGDALAGPGQVFEIHALQKGNARIGDYHGFLGNLHKLMPSLEALREFDALVPSHGDPIRDPSAAIDLLRARLDALWTNHARISCLNHYFPGMLQEYTPPGLTAVEPAFIAETRELPSHVLIAPCTSRLVRSDGGAGLLIDCGHRSVVDWVRERIADGTISRLDAVWITHYHDDHVDALPDLVAAFGCAVGAVAPLVDVIEHPEAWFLPCISPAATPVTMPRHNGEIWRWHEYTLTPYHLPGQTLYHSGLFVEGHGANICFAGDSGSPTGIDDHNCGNRCFLRNGGGFRRVFEIWRAARPDFIVNEHQKLAFRFSDEQLDLMDSALAERERIVGELVPWPDPNFALDEHWVRLYPYEQTVARGKTARFEVRFTNHADRDIVGEVQPVPPEGWSARAEDRKRIVVPARTDGDTGPQCARPDGRSALEVAVPEGARPGQHIVPIRVTWDGRYLGQYRHAVANVV